MKRRSWQVLFTRQAQKDAKRLATSGLRPKAEALLKVLAVDPFQSPPPFEKLVGEFAGAYSRRINLISNTVSSTKCLKMQVL